MWFYCEVVNSERNSLKFFLSVNLKLLGYDAVDWYRSADSRAVGTALTGCGAGRDISSLSPGPAMFSTRDDTVSTQARSPVVI